MNERPPIPAWNNLKVLLAVARAGGASAASEQMGISHATVSRRIAALERQVHVNLVDRSGLAWVITPLGRELAQIAEKTEQSVDEITRISRAHSHDLAGTVRILTPGVTMATLLAPALAGLRAEHPEIRFDFTAQDNLVDLRDRKADIALRFVEKPDQDLIGQMTCGVSWAVYASPGIAADISSQLHAHGPGYLPMAPILTPDAPGRLPDWAEGRFSADCRRLQECGEVNWRYRVV